MISITCDLKRLEQLSFLISRKISKNSNILLHGCIGSGKTTFANYLIRFLGITNITSSTFNIINIYKANNILIKHFDLYRIKTYIEMHKLVLENCKNDITIVEWGEVIKNSISHYHEIYFSFCRERNLRNIEISNELL